jgi:hypothetical protein
MEHIQTALQYAYQAKPLEFKDSIVSAIEDKLSDALMMKKMSFASTVLKHDDESSEQEDSSAEISEVNPDEEL